MAVAVLIPLFNGAPWIAATLRCVIGQTLAPAEIVVVDDGSTDGSPEIARGFPGVTVVQHPGNGVHHARRYALSLTRSPLVAILDQDDLWHPGHLAELKLLLGRSPAPAAVGGCQAFADEAELRLQTADGRHHLVDLWESFPLRPIWTPSSVLMRRAALDAIGGWPTQFRFGADAFTWWRLAEREPLVRSAGATVGYRVHRDSLSARLRVSAPADFSQAVTAATEAALICFRQGGRKVAGLETRWAIHQAQGELIAAALGDDDGRLRAAAAHYAQSLAPESADSVRNWHGTLFYHLVPQGALGTLPGDRRRLLRLVKAWPGDPSASMESFIACLNSRAVRWSLLDQLRREPMRAHDWLMWARMARCAIADRYRRRFRQP